MKSSEGYAGRVSYSAAIEGGDEPADEEAAAAAVAPGKRQEPKVLGGPGNSNAVDPNPDDIPSNRLSANRA